MRTMNGRWSGVTHGAMVVLLGAVAAACSSGGDVESGVTGATTTGAGTSTTSTSTGQGGEGGSGGATTTSTSTSAGGGGTGGSATGGGGAGGATGSGGSGGGACTPVDEVCNGEDDDCDGVVDNGDPGGGAECSTGLKGVCSVGHERCTQGVMFCKPDHDPDEEPETCNGLDDDCNGFVDEGLTLKVFYKDADGDGLGTDSTIQACAQPPGYAEDSGDCNDNNPNIYPGATELCNDADDNCDGSIDEGVQKPTFYKDNDGDGFGGTTSKLACTAPQGYVEDSGDCNDFNKAIYPMADEACNGVDDNCNGLVDDGLPLSDVYADVDGDGHGGKNAVANKHCLINGTDAPVGYSLTKDDCDDSKSTVYPGAAELCDGVLNDCSLAVADYQCPTLCAGAWPVALGGSVGEVAVAQLDADAELEVVVSQLGHTLVLEHNGTVKWDKIGANYSYPSLADVDHDGVLDVLVTRAGTVSLLRGQDGATLQTLASSSSGDHYGVSIFDVDNDGWADAVPQGGPDVDLLRLGAGGALLSTTTYSATGGESFRYAPVVVGDLDADARPELLVGSANWTCSGQPDCKGRYYVFRQDGTLYNDPTWTDASKPWFQVTGYPSSFAGEGRWGGILDVDGDGVLEIGQTFNTGSHVWSDDGARINGASFSPTMAPVEASGALTTGALNATGGPIVDLEGDGVYEQIAMAGNGMSITKGGTPMDGYPIKIGGGAATVTDLNRDGALDVLWLGANNAVNCWTLKGGTYARERVLSEGAMSSAGSRGIYATYAYDPFEPNDPPSSPDPTASTSPRADFRAFEPWGLRDRYVSGGGWSHVLRALIGHGGDVDYYWFTNDHNNIKLVSSLPSKLRLDLDVLVYTPSGGGWQYACEAHVTDTTNGSLYFHSTAATGTCPLGMGGTKGFLVRVKGHDAGTDFGPWPYDLTWMRGY